MDTDLRHRLTAHLRRHGPTLHRLACGFGRARDADDILQTLYARWWRRLQEDTAFQPPEARVELFVCVKRVVIDQVLREGRERARGEHGSLAEPTGAPAPDEALVAFERLRFVVDHLPDNLAAVLMASLSAGRSDDDAVARELGLTHATYTTRLFKARRAAEDLARYFDRLAPIEARVLAGLRCGGCTVASLADELGLAADEVMAIRDQARLLLGALGKAAG